MSRKSSRKKLHETDKDTGPQLAVTGRYQVIARDPGKKVKRSTLAAGAVLWRGDPSDVSSLEVAIIHRPHYDDWSLAKGKVDPGESLPVTAVREIAEETGYEVRLGKLIGKVRYPVMDRTKVVYYWTGEVLGGEFTPNDEVDEIRWVSFDEAMQLLSYAVDTQVLAKAKKRFQLPATSRILYVRHGRAHRRQNWAGDDNLRPLDKKGRRQAEMLVPLLAAWRPERIYSALPDRCQHTISPLADELNHDITVDERFGDAVYERDPDAARAAIQEVIAEGGTSVICSQGLTIPAMIEDLVSRGRLPINDEIKSKKGSVWVLSFHDGKLTGADYLASPLPVK
ncbi:NTP pyrophosphohydrolase [Corynebacterium yudongzhengii]|uniref:NUDIX hydrolase n=1 Tax=Corynebacterium yudongzhengii TaxID=2080740 RepID=A0A2U1T946_9CORY|nr:NUDIX hydrolase [Corynebacterium yudongzhengii]AWB82036.1 NTP pyrophosphohydrolase [Corynebacterium yudongzhengii]PWC02540.1 NUDIX hydrolase [Corynebacterium yudongzhengii]